MPDNEEQAGDATRAFEDLRAEVSVLRRAIEALPEEWAANQPPDYTESLGEITQGLSNVVGRLNVIEQHPALNATPVQHQAAISAAGQDLMREAAGKLDRATYATAQHAQELAGLISTVRTQRAQRELLLWAVGVALVLGIVISPLVAGVLPFGLNGRVAALVMHDERWNAGGALMAAGSPEAWNTMVDEHNLATANQAILTACRAEAAQTKKDQRCPFIVPAPRP